MPSTRTLLVGDDWKMELVEHGLDIFELVAGQWEFRGHRETLHDAFRFLQSKLFRRELAKRPGIPTIFDQLHAADRVYEQIIIALDGLLRAA